MITHTYAICAYRESPFLEECILSVINQSVSSKVYIATSTPNEYIDSLAAKYGLEVFVNTGEKGITRDWNYAYSKADTRYVTIAHQDDIYLPEYTEEFLKTVKGHEEMLIYHTNYGEIRNGRNVDENTLLRVKRLMLRPLRNNRHSYSVFLRRRVLSMGNPICCPSVTFDRTNIPEPPFTHGFRSDEDWEAWERLSGRKGDFLYNPNILMRHRIHEDSETSNIIGDGARSGEDYIMFRKFWIAPVAKLLVKFYSKSENSNRM